MWCCKKKTHIDQRGCSVPHSCTARQRIGARTTNPNRVNLRAVTGPTVQSTRKLIPVTTSDAPSRASSPRANPKPRDLPENTKKTW